MQYIKKQKDCHLDADKKKYIPNSNYANAQRILWIKVILIQQQTYDNF